MMMFYMTMMMMMMMMWFQGSVVVFGAWASWTDDYDEYVADPENKNYCAYEPMMYAFVILIIKWVRLMISDDVLSSSCCR